MHLVGRELEDVQNENSENNLDGFPWHNRLYGGVGVLWAGLMCIKPGTLPDGTKIACRLCWQCIENRRNDWVGRCVAEGQTAKAWNFVCLTYGRDSEGNEDHPAAKVLTFSHFQKFIRLLKRHGFPCRYFVVGEYGSAKGRAHWHALLYWLDKVPPFAGHNSFGKWALDHSTEYGKQSQIRFNWQRVEEKSGKPVVYDDGSPAYYWPHGFAEVSTGAVAAVRYCCKYVVDDKKDQHRQGHLSMSKYPPLGTEYFMRVAEKHVMHGIAPQDLLYDFPDVYDRQGKKVQFLLKGATADRYLAHFVRKWAADRPGRYLPTSDLLEKWLDKQAAVAVKEVQDERLLAALLERANASRANASLYWQQIIALAQLGDLQSEMQQWREETGRVLDLGPRPDQLETERKARLYHEVSSGGYR